MSEAGPTLRQRTGASASQLRAVYQVMRILAEDDRERGANADRPITCAACRRGRPAAGSIRYDGATLCNGCATEYEVLRIAAVVDDLPAFLRRPTATQAG